MGVVLFIVKEQSLPMKIYKWRHTWTQHSLWLLLTLQVFCINARRYVCPTRLSYDRKNLLDTSSGNSIRRNGKTINPQISTALTMKLRSFRRLLRPAWHSCQGKEAPQALWEGRKQGKRSGVGSRLKANPIRPAIPSVLLANVCFLDSKLDPKLQLATPSERRNLM